MTIIDEYRMSLVVGFALPHAASFWCLVRA